MEDEDEGGHSDAIDTANRATLTLRLPAGHQLTSAQLSAQFNVCETEGTTHTKNSRLWSVSARSANHEQEAAKAHGLTLSLLLRCVPCSLSYKSAVGNADGRMMDRQRFLHLQVPTQSAMVDEEAAQAVAGDGPSNKDDPPPPPPPHRRAHSDPEQRTRARPLTKGTQAAGQDADAMDSLPLAEGANTEASDRDAAAPSLPLMYVTVVELPVGSHPHLDPLSIRLAVLHHPESGARTAMAALRDIAQIIQRPGGWPIDQDSFIGAFRKGQLKSRSLQMKDSRSGP
jgi:hypothetical protein